MVNKQANTYKNISSQAKYELNKEKISSKG